MKTDSPAEKGKDSFSIDRRKALKRIALAGATTGLALFTSSCLPVGYRASGGYSNSGYRANGGYSNSGYGVSGDYVNSGGYGVSGDYTNRGGYGVSGDYTDRGGYGVSGDYTRSQ